jgi:hypothetical protein
VPSAPGQAGHGTPGREVLEYRCNRLGPATDAVLPERQGVAGSGRPFRTPILGWRQSITSPGRKGTSVSIFLDVLNVFQFFLAIFTNQED